MISGSSKERLIWSREAHKIPTLPQRCAYRPDLMLIRCTLKRTIETRRRGAGVSVEHLLPDGSRFLSCLGSRDRKGAGADARDCLV